MATGFCNRRLQRCTHQRRWPNGAPAGSNGAPLALSWQPARTAASPRPISKRRKQGARDRHLAITSRRTKHQGRQLSMTMPDRFSVPLNTSLYGPGMMKYHSHLCVHHRSFEVDSTACPCNRRTWARNFNTVVASTGSQDPSGCSVVASASTKCCKPSVS